MSVSNKIRVAMFQSNTAELNRVMRNLSRLESIETVTGSTRLEAAVSDCLRFDSHVLLIESKMWSTDAENQIARLCREMNDLWVVVKLGSAACVVRSGLASSAFRIRAVLDFDLDLDQGSATTRRAEPQRMGARSEACGLEDIAIWRSVK